MPSTPTPEPAAAELRISAAAEILSLLREMQERALVLTLAAPDGASCAASLSALGPGQQHLSFSADASDPLVQALLRADEVIAVAFLDRIKVQFQLDNLLLVTGRDGSALRADLPQEMFRFQRRSAFRVQPFDIGAPSARLGSLDARAPRLRILDISMGGVALFVPEDAAPLAPFAPGAALGSAQLQLDRNTRLEVSLRVQHVSDACADAGAAPRGLQLGCAFEAVSTLAARDLQRYIDQTQKRRRVLHTR
jgi:c-di-GMP-binding flagellar brake protein YcgR